MKNIIENMSEIKGMNDEEDWCVAYVSGKMTRDFH